MIKFIFNLFFLESNFLEYKKYSFSSIINEKIYNKKKNIINIHTIL